MIRVAGYCRVSTDKDDQANSFASQQRYFREYIERQPDWELYDIYADEGITGTNTGRRIQFNRMIRDAYAGQFHLILTKEVSRFSRNILDAIAYTRELRGLGIPVLFMNDGINTADPDAELRLSIMASIAQEESRKTSSRVTWGQQRQMERGVVFGRSLLGYNVRNGVLTIDPAGAQTVRQIFHKYALEQMPAGQIARHLSDAGIPTSRGSTEWSANSVIRILHNEKYAGDLVQRKTHTPDYLTHKKQRNNGEVPLIRITDHHEPIVSREVWDLAQQRLQRNHKRSGEQTGHSNRYAFSGKIRCGECGAGFVGRFKKRADGSSLRRWSCGRAVRGGAGACGVGRILRDDDAMEMLKTALRHLPVDSASIVRQTASLAADAIRAGQEVDEPERLRREIGRIQEKKASAMDSYFGGEIAKDDMMAICRRYDAQLDTLRQRLELALEASRTAGTHQQLCASMEAHTASILSMQSESLVFCKQMVERLTVYKDRHMELRLAHLPMVFQFSQ